MKRHYVLTPAAQRDLDRIWDYTAEHWGRRQANDYIPPAPLGIGKFAQWP
ncbi:MAG TPA: type II toxin-antitoxin system RelE/ParE family toxin [Devosia sp.]|nr:type II toxin-antitoxin system RelE/ParE family toxin [Devosia sp.]